MMSRICRIRRVRASRVSNGIACDITSVRSLERFVYGELEQTRSLYTVGLTSKSAYSIIIIHSLPRFMEMFSSFRHLDDKGFE